MLPGGGYTMRRQRKWGEVFWGLLLLLFGVGVPRSRNSQKVLLFRSRPGVWGEYMLEIIGGGGR